MDDKIKEQLLYLGLKNLAETWGETLKLAEKKKSSYHRFLSDIISEECIQRKEQKRIARLKAAKIPEILVMETYPFARQPQLRKKMVMELYDSMNFLSQSRVLCFIGPTGCGKSGLATSYLIHAINQGYRGLFISFKDLVDQLFKSAADFKEKKVLKAFEAYDCLVIDEIGYRQINKDEAGLFFELMKTRHGKGCTIITSQIGFDEWDTFLKNKHLTMALLDRITECCTVFDMQNCISIRKKDIKYATEKQSA